MMVFFFVLTLIYIIKNLDFIFNFYIIIPQYERVKYWSIKLVFSYFYVFTTPNGIQYKKCKY